MKNYTTNYCATAFVDLTSALETHTIIYKTIA